MVTTVSKEVLLTSLKSFTGSVPQLEGFDEELLGIILIHAVNKYNRDVPRRAVTRVEEADITNNKYFSVTSLTDWEEDFSILQRIETVDIPPCEVEYMKISKDYIELINTNYSPPFNVYSSALHIFTDSESSIPQFHSNAVIYLALSEVCTSLSLRYEQGVGDDSYGASINFDTKASDLRKLSEVYLKRYNDELYLMVGSYASTPRYNRPRLKDGMGLRHRRY